ncbi:MAG: ankyrin repeat domain-containing protein [Selenomonadaceae bacterium]|nr:ankyrin repeat domain-containing protein [Selenomonadaceae bacterium]
MKKSISVLVMAAVMAGSTTFMPMHTAEAGGLADVIEGVIGGIIHPHGGNKKSGSNSGDTSIINNLGKQKHAVRNPNQTQQLFLIAVHDGENELVAGLLKDGIDVNGVYYCSYGSDGITPLAIAINRGNRSMQQLLLENGADVTGYYDYDNIYHNYFVNAAIYGNLELMKYLHNWGAPINGIGSYRGSRDMYVNALAGNIWYHDASERGCLAITEYLIDEGILEIDYRISRDRNNTPYLEAVKNRQYNMINLLASNGADIFAKNDDGKNALQMALDMKDLQLYKYIQDINARGQQPSKKKQ